MSGLIKDLTLTFPPGQPARQSLMCIIWFPDNTHQKYRYSYNALKLKDIMKFLGCILSGSKVGKRFYQETIYTLFDSNNKD